MSIPRRTAAAAAAVLRTGRAGRGLGLGLDDEQGVASTEDVVVDGHPVQILLDSELKKCKEDGETVYI